MQEDVITIMGDLIVDQDDVVVLEQLMRSQSSCMHSSHGKLLKGDLRRDLKRDLQDVFRINSRYVDDAIFNAQPNIASMQELDENPKHVMYAGMKLFSKLQNCHLSEFQRA